jgi:hypothetical protein
MAPQRPLGAEVLDEISVLVRSGFYDEESILEIVCEEMHEPGELAPAAVSAAIDECSRLHVAEQAGWPAVTDCDRLERAFAALTKRGIIALENAGNTQSDGYSDFVERYEASKKKKAVIGYCFYHGQDLERAVRGEGLYLAFGPADPEDEEAAGARIGGMVKEELERTGLAVEWNGTFSKRIAVPTLVWQRRSR